MLPPRCRIFLLTDSERNSPSRVYTYLTVSNQALGNGRGMWTSSSSWMGLFVWFKMLPRMGRYFWACTLSI